MADVARPIAIELLSPNVVSPASSSLHPQDIIYPRKTSTSSTSSTIAPSTSSQRRGTRKAVPTWTGSLERLSLETANSSILSPQPAIADAVTTKPLLISSSAQRIPFDSTYTMRERSKPMVAKNNMLGPALPRNFVIPTRMDSLSPHHHVLTVEPPTHAMLGTPVVIKNDRRPSERTDNTDSIESASSHFSNLFFVPTSPDSSMPTSQSTTSSTTALAAPESKPTPPSASAVSRQSPRTDDWVEQHSYIQSTEGRGRQGSIDQRLSPSKPVVWSDLEEVAREGAAWEPQGRAPRSKSRRPKIAVNIEWEEVESRQERKARKKAEHEVFNMESKRVPDLKALFEVSQMEVTAEDGTKVKFGDIVSGGGGRKTVVVFIRHWYCPLCSEYMESIIREVDLEALVQANVNLVVIGNGSSKMASGYRRIFKCPFSVYTDTKLRVYRGLGMTRQTMDGGPEDLKGDYISKGTLQGTLMVVKNARKMPLRRPGAFAQLGGEFIFTSPLNCTFANRMTTTRDHASIREVVGHAGVVLDFVHRERGPTPPPWHRLTPTYEAENDEFTFGNWGETDREVTRAQRLAMEERRDRNGEGWKVERERELERIRNERLARRGLLSQMGLSACDAHPEEDDDDGEPEHHLEQDAAEGSEATIAAAVGEETVVGGQAI